MHEGAIRRITTQLISNKYSWQYVGVRRELLACNDNSVDNKFLAGVKIQLFTDPELERQKRISDISFLQQHLSAHKDDVHALFNLAKLTMLNGDHAEALDAFNDYLNCADKLDPEWHWYALYHKAKLAEKLQHKVEDVIGHYETAYEFRIQRTEPLYELARLYREQGKPTKSHVYAHRAFAMPIPEMECYDLDQNLYDWLIPNEFAIASQKLGFHEEAVIASNKAIQNSNKNKNIFRSLVASRQRSLVALRNQLPRTNHNNINRIRVVVPYRNAGELLIDTVRSLQTQDYENFSATFIDDCSTDDSNSYIPTDDERIELIVNKERVGPLVNRMDFINSCEPSDIVLYLDGDDQLASDDALSYINQIYNEYDCWFTYGQYLSQNGRLGYAQPYASQQALIDELETGMMRFPMHPITHRAALFHKLKEFDPSYTCLKDDNGEWLFYASDAVLARPLFYMAGFERIHYCNRVLYLYTEGHEISESIHNKKDQLETCRITTLRLRPPKLSALPIQ